ncbi:MAG: YhbY family RNA-binding protein [Oscillospiraceae bacterium]|nr:YhbY family RNA-binding protein [Oscillospiraceae bacterium]
MTSKERARLRGLASQEPTIVQVGKEGITENVIQSVNTALAARELIKGKVLESSMLTAREACEKLAEACGAEPVQAIGTKFVLYRKKED